MQKTFPIAIAFVLILLCTVVQGIYSYRYTSHKPGEDLLAMVQRLQALPMNIGSWKGEDLDTDFRVEQVAGIVGSVNRRYVHPAAGTVSIALAVGDRRNMSTHTPERCYRAAGWNMGTSGAYSYTVPSEVDDKGNEVKSLEMLTATFRHDDVAQGSNLQQVFWAWNDGQEWIVPSSDPRLPEWMGGLPSSQSWYKLYIMCDRPAKGSAQVDISETAGYKFVRDLMPALSKALSPAAQSSSEANI
jgi:hypothetical protein